MRRTNRKLIWLCFLFVTLFIISASPPAWADTLGPAIDSYSPANGAKLPGGWVTVSIRVLDIDGIQPGSQQLLINGQAVPVVMNYDVKSVDPVTETTIYDFTHAIITYRKIFTDGVYNVQFSIRDKVGNPTNLNWSFEASTTPTYSNLTPAPNSSTTNTTPTISATLSISAGDSIDPASVVMTLNGAQVAAAFDPATGLASYIPASPLTVGETYFVNVSAADINGHSSNTQWEFSMVYPDMPVPTDKLACLKCHSQMPQAHRMSNCAACHNVALRNIYANQSPPPHFVAYDCYACHTPLTHETGAIAGQPAWYPIDAKYNCNQCHQHNNDLVVTAHRTTTTGCEECHSKVLTREHFRRTDAAGNQLNCYTCHNSTKPEVQQAIATKNTACTACHTNPNHNIVHDNPTFTQLPRDPDMDCSVCHSSAISSEHISGKFTSTKGYTCDTCHNSTRPEVKAAIANKNKNCDACHIDPVTQQPNIHTSSGPPLHDTTYVVNPDLNCADCHAGNLKTVHVGQPGKINPAPMDCATCHNSTDPGVQSAILSKNTNCDACHTSRHANASHDIPAGYVNSNPNNLQCANCHQGNSLPDLHVGKVTKSGVTMTCGTCHNNTTNPLVKQAILAKTANCDACHSIHADVTTVHSNPAYTTLAKDPDMDCSQCHNSVISDEHLARKDSAGQNFTCGTCHDSTRPEVKTAIAGSNKNCDACHIDPVTQQPKIHTSSGSPLHDTVFDVNKEVDCTQCHAANVKDVHVGKPNKLANNVLMNCATCHQSTNPAVQAAIAAKDTKCSTCHTSRHTAVTHTDPTGFVNSSSNPNNLDCSQCHKQALPDEHLGRVSAATGQTLDCNSCHTSTRTEVKTAISTGNVKCDACHTTGIHPDLAPKHQSPSDMTSATNMIDCSWCHTNTLTDTHINPTVKLSKTLTCATCHDSASPVSNQVKLGQKLCTDCHNGVSAETPHPGKQYIPKHTAVFPTFLPEYSPNCVNCHNNGTPGGTPTLDALHSTYNIGCSDCHTNQTYKTAITGQNTNCAGCHDKTTNPAINPAMDMTDGHKQFHNSDTTKYPDTAQCLSCHGKDATADGQTLLAVHRKNPASTVTCDTCHGTAARQEAKDAIAAKNISCQACHSNVNHNHQVTAYEAAPQLNCATCHATGTVTDPATGKISNTTELTQVHSKYGKDCATCHDAATPFPGNIIAKDGTIDLMKNGTTPIYCSTCHNGDTANKYAPTAASKHAPEHQASQSDNVNCSSCHDGATVKGGAFSAPAGTAVSFTGIHATNACNTCHDNAKVQDVISSKVGKDNTGANAYNCDACHDGTKAKTHNKQHTVKSYLTGSSDTSCGSCHSNGDVTAIHSGATSGGKTLNCDTCHGASPTLPNTAAVIKANLSSNASRAGFTCQDCHSDITGGHNHSVAANGYDANPQVDCTKCHAAAADGTAELTAIHKTAADQGKIPNYGCTTCHNDKFVGAGKVILGDGKLDLKQNGTTQIYCTTCHNGTLADALGAKYPAHDGNHVNSTGYGTYKGTYNGQAFDDSAADCSKCHASLDTKVIHDPVKYPGISCNTCHQSTNPDVQATITGAWSRAATKTAYDCSSCHSTLPYLHKPEHTGTSTAAASLDCSSCHNAASWTGSSAQLAGVHNNNCNICHASSNSVVSSFILSKKGQTNPVYNCESCHTTGGAQTKEAVHKPEHQAKHSAANMDCISCHGFTVAAGTPTDISSASIHKNGCNTCHSSNTRSDVKLLVASKVGQSNPVYNCEDCHGTIHANLDAKHTGPALPTTPWTCSKCHTNVLSVEHSGNATLKQNAGLSCSTCHSSSLAKVKAAISSTATDGSNLACTSCHTGTVDGATKAHTDIATPHLTGIFPTAADSDCLKCHTTQTGQFVATAASYHAVNGLTSKASGWGKFISPWTSTSQVGCKGCHGDKKDGQAQASKILIRPYTYTSSSGQSNMLCFVCHDRGTYGGGSFTGRSGFSTSGGSNNLHNIWDHKVNNVVQCSWCHSSQPHATTKPHLIVTKGDPNSTGNLLTKFTHPASGTYSKSSCGSADSRCDEHKSYQ